ncbi:hypothetical protein ABW19_dt0206330 [Dactylella cylindrospora]|nr:hypothetical protein ABW19_dt0206330 [Dactylella cylindrospora]
MRRWYVSISLIRSVIVLQLLAASAIYAQENICDEETRTANSQLDLDKLQPCVTLKGNLVLGPGLRTAALRGVQTIRGDLTSEGNENLEEIQAPNLSFIGGLLSITDSANFSALSMPSLANLGSLRLENLPGLQELQFGSQVDSPGEAAARQLVVINTGLESITEIIYRYAETVKIQDNPSLDNINLPLINVTSNLIIRNNQENTNLTLNRLEWANEVILGGLIGSLNTPRLKHVNGNLRLSDNTYTALSMPALTSVGPSREAGKMEIELAISNSPQLQSVSFLNLQWVTDYLRINSTSPSWTVIDGFPVLQSVGRDTEIEGEFSKMDFPSLRSENPWSSFAASGADLNCEELTAQTFIQQGGWVSVYCNNQNYFTASTVPEDNSGLSGSEIAGVVMGSVGAVLLALFAILFYLRWKGQWIFAKRKTARSKLGIHDEGSSKIELHSESIAELQDTRYTPELDNSSRRFAPELDGDSIIAELDGTPCVPRDSIEHEKRVA